MDKFKITNKDINDYTLFAMACEYNQIKTALWMIEKFKLTREEILSDENCALRWSVNRLNILKWLKRTYHITEGETIQRIVSPRITKEEAMRMGCHAFRDACENKHLKTAKWLKKTFDLSHTQEEIIEKNLPLPHRDLIPVTVEEQIIAFADKFFSKSMDVYMEKSLREVRKSISKFGKSNMDRFEEWCELFL